MFKKKLKNVISKLHFSEKIDLAITLYGENLCNRSAFGDCLNYYTLYNLKDDNHGIYVFQQGEEKTILNMDPFCEAIVILKDYRTKLCQIHKFRPLAFTEIILLKNMSDIKPNFQRYNIFRADGSKVFSFEELRSWEEFFAISKDTFTGTINNRYFSKEHPLHMMLRWGMSINKNIL